MLSQLSPAERRRVRLICAYRRAREIWGHLWPILAMLAMSAGFAWFGLWVGRGLAR